MSPVGTHAQKVKAEASRMTSKLCTRERACTQRVTEGRTEGSMLTCTQTA